MSFVASALTDTNSAFEILEALGLLLDPASASWQSGQQAHERREAIRVPLVQEICVVGLGDDFEPATAPLLMDGRDISGQGLSFSHGKPITTRFAAVSFKVASGIETVVVRLAWCRFSRPGSYVSGGKFVKYRPIANIPSDWTALERG